jgi:hypothetical protein
MSNEINGDRRQFLGSAAMTVAVTQFAAIGLAHATALPPESGTKHYEIEK